MRKAGSFSKKHTHDKDVFAEAGKEGIFIGAMEKITGKAADSPATGLLRPRRDRCVRIGWKMRGRRNEK